MDYQQWIGIHRQQLETIPDIYWETLFRKLCTETFDAGEYFVMTPSSQGWSVKISNSDGLVASDANSVFIVDHAWTYLPDKCYEQLSTIPGLALRMANLMDLIERPTTPIETAQEQEEEGEGEEEGEAEINGVNGREDIDSASDDSTTEEHTDGVPLEEEREEEEEEEYYEDTREETEGEPLSLPSEDLIEQVMSHLWRFNDWYSIANMPVPIWYVMEDYAARIPHSQDAQNVAIVPFFNILTQMSYSILWPLHDLQYGEALYRDHISANTLIPSALYRKCLSLPWLPSDALLLSDPLWAELDSLPLAPMPERVQEEVLSEVTPRREAQPPPSPLTTTAINVYSDMEMVKKHLNHPSFELVKSEESAIVLWYFEHFKDYKSLFPHQLINQFPSENVLTCKDLLIGVGRRSFQLNKYPDSTPKHDSSLSLPDWLPESYNLFYELPQFVHKFKEREIKEEDNTWIIKPWNLGRSMDIFITKDLPQIIRLSQASPKVACKYINNPVLFERPGIGKVKMDIRYILLLVSVKPLVLYAYKTFWLRFANKPFSMNSFHDYETHFTVMNYKEDSPLKHLESVDFIPLFEEQYPHHPWNEIQENIFHALYELFTAAGADKPPAGITNYPQSRAMYAVDLMLEWSPPDEGCGCQYMQPRICEINFCPDCNRACQYHPSFVNDVFECLFLAKHSPDLPVTRITGKQKS